MPEYRVTYFTKQGKKEKRAFVAVNREELVDMMRKNQMTILEIREKGKGENRNFFSVIKGLNRINITGTSVDETTLIMFSRQLGSMIGAGLPILQSLETLARDEKNPEFKETLGKVIDDIRAGIAFSDSIGKYPKIFSNLFVNMIKSAEASGGLDVTLISISEYIERLKDIKDKVKSATRYPLLVLGVILAASIGLMLLVVPKFKNIYTSVNADLPAVTKIVMNLSEFIKNHIFLIAVIITGVVILLRYLIRTNDKVRYVYHKFLINFPKLGEIYRMGILVNFTKTFGLLLIAGINIVKAIELSGNIINNEVYKVSLKRINKKIQQGYTIYDSLQEEGKIYPSIFVQMVGTGEETGSLDDMLLRFNAFFDSEINKRVDKLSQIIEPMLIIIMASLVLVLTLAIYMPVFSLGRAIQGR